MVLTPRPFFSDNGEFTLNAMKGQLTASGEPKGLGCALPNLH